MANIHDYLRWRGDLEFVERPFNDVDNLVLSALVYLDFTNVVPSEGRGGSITLREACRALLAKAKGDVTPYVRSLSKIDTSFVKLIGESKRFGDARLSAYADVVDAERDLQFGALRIDLPQACTYVAFRGTDTTLVGWRENFKISFLVTAAQQEAVRYLGRVIEHAAAPNDDIRVGGHSKGGNLAEYAAACSPEHLRERITRVYSNDGPGMAPEVLLRSPRATMGGRTRLIVPTYSIVGMLFARRNEERSIVASSAFGIEQHDIVTWQVLRDGVEEAGALDPDCVVINETIASWTSEIPLGERELITQKVFDALQAGGATTLGQIVESPDKLKQVLRALGRTDDRTRGIIMELVQRVVSSEVDATVNKAAKRVGDASRRLKEGTAKRAGIGKAKKTAP